MRGNSYSAAVQLLVCSLAAAVLLSQIVSATQWQRFHVKTPSGQTILVVYEPHYDTPEFIKAVVEERSGIPAGKQTLYFGDTALEDGKEIYKQGLNIQPEADLTLVVSGK